MKSLSILLVPFLLTSLASPSELAGQSVLDRTPNVSGAWVGQPGRAYFNFLHRFRLVDAGDESVLVNTPTFLLATPPTDRTLLGVRYASSSGVTPGKENEWEFFGRWTPLRAGDGGPVDLGVTGAYNTAATSFDAELLVALPVDRLTLLGVGRYFSDPAGRGDASWAGGGGAVVRLTDGIALAGDVVSETDLPDARTVAWGAGIQVRIPLTPHTLSIQATNTRTGSLQGSSEGTLEPGSSDADQVLWGFEFTIPITFSRYF